MKIEDLALELKKDYTIVIVTHNMQQASRISVCDKTAFFLLGELIEYGETTELFANPKKSKNRRIYYWQIWLICIVRLFKGDKNG